MANNPPLLKDKDKPKKQRKKTTSKLKKELDKIYSLYIRHKYAKNGEVTCYTCGIRKGIKQMQCGHFVSRAYLSTRYDERNTRPQCTGCNIFGGGRSAAFATKLSKDYGEYIVPALYRKAQEITKDFPYERLIEIYKEKLNQLI